MKTLTGLLVLLLVPALLMACSGDSDDQTGRSEATTSDPVDEADILNSVEDVQSMIVEAATDLDPNMVIDVDYSDNVLTVTLAEERDTSDVDSMETACNEISSAIALPDLEVRLQSADGNTVAECMFS